MGNARRELEARLDEVCAASHFMDRAYRLRPRIGQAINWNGPRHEVDLLREFIVDDGSREEEILGALYIRSVAAFERYIRKACSEAIEARARKASEAGKLPQEFKLRHLVLSAKLLGSLDHPKDYISFNPASVVERMNSCEKDTMPYQLNSISFSASLQSPTADAIEKILATVGLNEAFEVLGRSTALQALLNTRGTRNTNTRSQERIGEIVRWRNNFAHGGDDERTVTLPELDSIIAFLRTIAIEIDNALETL